MRRIFRPIFGAGVGKARVDGRRSITQVFKIQGSNLVDAGVDATPEHRSQKAVYNHYCPLESVSSFAAPVASRSFSDNCKNARCAAEYGFLIWRE